ncbi:MAG: ABC transporter ATP-binding protein [Spirochaetales bacterium]|nr:ABC transporter ATP-binding protein [Spirochaetales bacterium]
MDKKEFRVAGAHIYNTKSPVRWITSHVLRYPVLPFLVVFTAILNNMAYSNIQIYIGKSFDRIVSPSWQIADLMGLVLIIVLSAVAQGLTGVSRNFSVEFLAQRIERNAREELYISLLGKSQTFHGRQRIGDIMAKATNDVRMLNAMFAPGMMLITDSLLAFIVPFIAIAMIHPWLLLVPSVFAVLLFITVLDYNRRLEPVSISQRDQFGKMNAGLAEAIEGIEVVKANVRENHEWNKFTGDARVFRDYFVTQGKIQARYWPMLVFAISWGLILLHSLHLWSKSYISIGQVVAVMGLFNTFRYTTFISIFSFNLVQLGIASAKRILETINAGTELDENSTGLNRQIKGNVEFRNVSFSFSGRKVLDAVSFSVKAGETVAIVGQTGSGKTTLTRMINRIFDPDEGSILVDGEDIRTWNLESLRSQISTIEQDIFLFSTTIRRNIAFGLKNADENRIQHAASEAQADEFILSFKDGYKTEIGERGVALSGGQKQRLAIARAFLTNPKILILDDSTSAIDSATEDRIQKAMKRISSERTTFLITHRLSQIRWADKVCLIDKGRIIDFGSHDELMARSDTYKRIFSGV